MFGCERRSASISHAGAGAVCSIVLLSLCAGGLPTRWSNGRFAGSEGLFMHAYDVTSLASLGPDTFRAK